MFVSRVEGDDCPISIDQGPTALGRLRQEARESGNTRKPHFADEERRMRADAAVLEQDRRGASTGQEDGVGWKQTRRCENAADGNLVKRVGRDARKGLAQAYREIPKIVPLVPGDLGFPQ